MAPRYLALERRSGTIQLDRSMVNLLTALLILLAVALILTGVLLFVRQRQRARRAHDLLLLPEKRPSSASSHHRRKMARPCEPIHIRQSSLESGISSPVFKGGVLPEIRITLPEEVDSTGKLQSGRVVVVHIGENNIGLEPHEEKLLEYYDTDASRFHSLDLDRVGGLIEKEPRPRWQ